jgi:hypothetical protein
MEVVMFIDPNMAALIVKARQLELEARARKEYLRRDVRPKVQADKPKIPARVPRFWRWRYLWAK